MYSPFNAQFPWVAVHYTDNSKARVSMAEVKKVLSRLERKEMACRQVLQSSKKPPGYRSLFRLGCTPAICPFSIFHIYHNSRAVFIIKI